MEIKASILIVEDDALVALDLKQALTDLGYRVVGTADSGENAIAQSAALKPQFILIDIKLKGPMDGIEAASKITGANAVPIVFLTAMNDEETLQRAKLTHPYGYLIKPFDPAELRSTIELTMHRFHREKDASPATAAIDSLEPIVEGERGELENKLQILTQIKAFQGTPRPLLEMLSQTSSIRALEGGEFLVIEGEEPPNCGFIVLSGRVSVTKTSASGKDLIVSLLGPGDVFGLFYLMHSFTNSSSARTQTGSRVLWIPKNSFLSVVEKRPEIYQALCEEILERLVASYELASSLAHTRVEDRIVTTLLALLPSFGRKVQTSANEGRIYITRKDLADLTGTTPETAIRVTKNLEREGYLDLSRPGIVKIVDIEGLRHHLSNDKR